MLPSHASIIFSIAISVRLDAILDPPAYATTGSIRDELGLNSALCENIWWRRGISTTCYFRSSRKLLTTGLRTLPSNGSKRSHHAYSRKHRRPRRVLAAAPPWRPVIH